MYMFCAGDELIISDSPERFREMSCRAVSRILSYFTIFVLCGIASEIPCVRVHPYMCYMRMCVCPNGCVVCIHSLCSAALVFRRYCVLLLVVPLFKQQVLHSRTPEDGTARDTGTNWAHRPLHARNTVPRCLVCYKCTVCHREGRVGVL